MSFIQAELDAGITFANIARSERRAGNGERARRNIELAQRACEEARRRVEECNRAEAPQAFDAAHTKLATLLGMIDALLYTDG
ncbi:MAG: hypothetical protein KIT09_19610 [Bryobacteraceae bacterium]|nr:hypothetical protein [Bryobacteraceae bacterium]